MKFQRYLYSVSLNGLSIAKYADGDKVVLIAEKDGDAVSSYDELRFDDSDKYIEWIDKLIGGRDEFSANAQIVNDVLEYMQLAQATAQQRASTKYVKKVRKPQVVINPDIDSELLDAIDNDDTTFSELCKQLLKQHYNIA